MERVFLRNIVNPSGDFLKNCFLTKDCSLSLHTLNPEQVGFAQLQVGGASGNLLYACSCEEGDFPLLIEDLCVTIGELGKTHLLANVPAESDQLNLLQRNGFSTYSKHTLWEMDFCPPAGEGNFEWRSEINQDRSVIRSFYAKHISPLEASLQTWSFADTFHLILQDRFQRICGVARVRFYLDRAVVLPMLDNQQDDPAPWLYALFSQLSQSFSTLFVREPVRQDGCHPFLTEHARVILAKNHWLVRNLVNLSEVRELQPSEFRDERSIPRPTTPCTKN
jgi:hypothetical protein